MDHLSHRTAPGWVRALTHSQLHALAGRLQREFRQTGLSDGQEWLFDRCLSELAYRRRIAKTAWEACSCELCMEPFPDFI